MHNLQKRTIEYYDYLEMRDYIKEKYNIEERDYSGAHSFNYTAAYSVLGYSPEDVDRMMRTVPAKMTPQEKIDNDIIRQQLTQWKEDHPYQDFWHFMLEYFDPFGKGKPLHLNWADVKDFAKQDWQKEICDLYIAEFGEEDYTVIVDW